MPDPYASIAEADPQIQERLAGVLELRAADPQQRAMLESYLGDIGFPQEAQVLDLGCDTGAVSRVLARKPAVARVIGVDPVPAPDRVLAEAFRVLRRGGWLSVFDGDYATTTVALEDNDPLQACVDAAIAWLVHDRWLFRRLPSLVRSAGFRDLKTRSHGYLETSDPNYMVTIVERGADFLLASGRVGPDVATALKLEAKRRADAGQFFGHIAYASIVARKLD